ncbi:MAG: ParB/RepB/Spo0J family partition protein [Clostridia bacterium]|nr:ParB/RepB/Spo0J family partition protein [Clostridia bacterium]
MNEIVRNKVIIKRFTNLDIAMYYYINYDRIKKYSKEKFTMPEEINRDYTKTLSMFQSTAPEQKTTISGVAENDGCVELSISMLEHFPDHPFELYDGERFEDLAASIKEHGLLSPVLVRKMDDGRYQILSGHNRCECAKSVGFKTVPCIVFKNLSDDDALMIVLDSNTKQRGITEMKISKQARIYALDVEVNRRQGKRSDLIKNIEKNLEILSNNADFSTCSQFGNKLKTIEVIGHKYGVSKNTIARLLRIDTLIDELKLRIDDEEFAVNAGVELSYLPDVEQEIIDDVLREFDYRLDIKKARQIREVSKAGKLNKVTVVDILEGKYNKSRRVNTSKIKAFTLKPKFLEKYYTPEISQAVIAEDIENSMDLWKQIKRKYPELSSVEIKAQIDKLLDIAE